jgi:signal transduction histidine kinase/diacylglycerol kinase
MFEFFSKSLRKKLFITFIIIGFLPFLTLLVYTVFLSEAKILKRIVLEQNARVDDVSSLIDQHIKNLSKEIKFLGSLDVMDDIIVDDLDKRISRLLSQKAKDFGSLATFMAINTKKQIIASSDSSVLLSKFKHKFDKSNGQFINEKNLYTYIKVFSTFDNKNELGYLVLKYNLDKLEPFLPHLKNTNAYITNTNNTISIGSSLDIKLDFTSKNNNLINDTHLIVYKNLQESLKDFYLVYAVDKSVALEFLYDFLKFMFYVSLVIFIFIIYVSIKFSSSIVKPVENLTKTVDKTIQTQDYATVLSIESKDEIAKLTSSFNELLQTTDNALKKLEEENKHRLQRFVQLINIFNIIIQTQDEDECIKTSIKEISSLSNTNLIHFSQTIEYEVSEDYISLYITDFEEEDKKNLFGYILLGKSLEDEHEKGFYNSIAKMITLQLDRIRLIDKTMSASRAKSAFISNMSHELRTPLNAIIGFAQYMINYEDLEEDQIDTVSSIESSAQYLLSMINEILDIAKIESGKMEVHLEQSDIMSLVQSSYEMLLPLAKEKDIEFNLETDGFIQDSYETDVKMFKQIVINLLSNAIKFTKEGGVTLKLFNQDNKLVVEVIDTGIGISSEDIKNLFSDFTQVENIMQKKHKGTGLGLSLSKKMANLLRGDVDLDSKGANKGSKSTFYISI